MNAASAQLELSSELKQSVAAIRRKTQIQAQIGIVLGSGLGGLARFVTDAISIPYDSIPHMPHLSAAGHAAEWIMGRLAGVEVVMMRGRAHLYEGHSWDKVTYGVRLMAALGAQGLIVSNAAGGVNPRFRVGQIVLIDSHINQLRQKRQLTSQENLQSEGGGVKCLESDASLPSLIRRTPEVYSLDWLESIQASAQALGHSLSRGTYLATSGPTYETRAEYRAFRMMGADMVGMSTVPEVLVAASLGLRVLGFSVITNVALPDSLVETHHDDVLNAANIASGKLVSILQHWLPQCSAPI